MSIFQALLLALFGWMSSIYSPVLMGGLGGWYTLGRPLVSGMVIGIILGDVQTGIIMGAAIQMLYIGLVTLGVFAVYGLCAINLFFVHKQDAYIEKGEFDKAARIPIVGQITNIVLRFFPILIINYFGADLVTQLVNIMPLWLTDILQIFANMLPLVGFMLLMRTLVKKDLDLIYFVLGFILVSVANIGMIPIVIAALVIAYLKYQMSEKEA